jgi:glutathione S-transferase
MKLYNSIGPNPRLVRIFAHEKGIELDLVAVDLMAAENRQEAYKQKNPAGQIPCLELDNGQVIAETTVICEYLEDVQPAPALIGSTSEERANTRMWTRRAEFRVTTPMADGFRYAEGLPLFKDRMRTIPQAADDLKTLAREGLEWLDGEMSDRDYVAGDQFSLADIVLFSFLEFGATVGQPADPSLKRLASWYERVSARPSIQATA